MTNGRDNPTGCDLSRRNFWGSMLKQVGQTLGDAVDAAADASSADSAAARSSRYQQPFPVLRPPGAVEESAFLDGCTKCEACILACPHDAIIKAPARFRRAAETPMIDPLRQPCWMCEGYPCIDACEPGVLRHDVPKQMGTARIETFSCLAYQGTFCTVCHEQCPVEGAIELCEGKPQVIEERCTGCGVCQHVCPAPANAILLMPLAKRPLPPSKTIDDDGKPGAREAS